MQLREGFALSHAFRPFASLILCLGLVECSNSAQEEIPEAIQLPVADKSEAGDAPVETSAPAPALVPVRSSGQWQRLTYAGPGHAEHPGPWGPGQGSDRTEWVAAFGCSPVNPNFMLQCTDLGRLVFTNSRLQGTEFIPASIPMRYGSMVAFHPAEPRTGFALMAESPSAIAGLGGWWMTEDEGETWRHILRTPAWRAQKQTFAVHPGTGDFFVGTQNDGLLRSTDRGKTWEPVAFPKKRIWTLKFAKDGSVLYLIVANENNPRWNDWSKGGGELHVVPFRNGIAGKPDRVGSGNRWWDVDVHPSDAAAGVLVENMRVIYRFSGMGRGLEPITPEGGDRFDYCVINPANPDHLLAGAAGTLLSGRFRWSSDGGKTWGRPRQEDGWIPNFQDYGPANHRSKNHWFIGGDVSVGAERTLVAFVPGDPKSVLYWGSNIIKGPYRSDDYGEHYKPFAHGGNFKQAVQISTSPDGTRLAVSTNEYGFVLSRDGGLTWRGYHKYNTPQFPQNLGERQFWSYRSPYGVGIDPSNPDVVLGTFGMDPTHVLRTEDFGQSWQSVHTLKRKNPDTMAVFFAPSDPNVVYVGSLRSEDGGRTFQKIDQSVSAVSAANPMVVVSKLSGRDIRWSDDGGETWHRLPEPPEAPDGRSTVIGPGSTDGIIIDPVEAHNPARGGHLRLLFAGHQGVWEFTAGDATAETGEWKLLPVEPWPKDPHGAPQWLRHLALDPRPTEKPVIYAFGGNIGNGRGEMSYRTVFRSSDGGHSWQWLANDSHRGELPDYLDITGSPVVDRQGTVSFHDTAGFYRIELP